MKQVEKKYRCIPFWSWNDALDKDELIKQIEWMNENGVGGFFMHARGGLKTEYLGKEWFECIDACSKKAEELGMEAYAYDENGWPSGFAGGKLLEDIENHDKYLTCKIGEYDKNALVSYDISTSCLKRTNCKCGKCLNVYEHYSASTADILNPEVVDKFLTLTHEEYRKRDTYNLKGFFTDEPQYYRWDTPYTKMLPKYFSDVYNEDILDGLGHLFVEKRGYRSFRYKYWRAMQSLMLENFAKKIYDWCDKYGYKLTGHYIEECALSLQMWCCAGIMPFYEYEHIPGIDYLGAGIDNELASKQVSSVGAQLGKNQIITETYGCCGWDVNPMELKKIAELQYCGGINLMCQHLLPYTEHGQRKRDYPAHYSPVNPWVKKGFKDFNDYFAVLGKTLAESDECVNVGVLHPIRSLYLNYKCYPKIDYALHDKIEIPLRKLMNTLCQKGIGHHFLDETLLAKYGKVSGKSLILGNCKYDYIILPKIYTMDKSTEKLLREYVNAGGKILLMDEKPTYLEGKRYSYDFLNSNTSFDEIIDAQPYTIMNETGIRATYRKDKDGREFIYAVNLGEEADVNFNIKNGKSFESYDIFSDEYVTISTKVHFDNGQSYLLYLSDKTPIKPKKLSPLKLENDFEVCADTQNYLTLDFVRYSFDGQKYSEPRHHMCVLSDMLEKKYCGKLYLKYEFNVEKKPSTCELLAENTNIIDVSINGNKISPYGVSSLEKSVYKYNIAQFIKNGKNEIIILIDYFQSEQVYYALFGENVTESLKNCLAYDTDIEPIYLKGDFGVYGRIEKGKNDNILLGDNFYIGERKTKISSLISDGYPFFAGDITLKQRIDIIDTDRELLIDKRFQLIDVKINGKYVGRMMFSNRLDVSAFLVKGENEIEITLTVSNRNLLGPFHCIEQEPEFVGPETFERLGSWKNGKSKIFSDKYAFLKGIL